VAAAAADRKCSSVAVAELFALSLDSITHGEGTRSARSPTLRHNASAITDSSAENLQKGCGDTARLASVQGVKRWRRVIGRMTVKLVDERAGRCRQKFWFGAKTWFT